MDTPRLRTARPMGRRPERTDPTLEVPRDRSPRAGGVCTSQAPVRGPDTWSVDIVERREHGGTWWGRTSDGAWFRWSATANAWEGPAAPPWPVPPQTPPHPHEEAIVAAAIAAAGPPDGVSRPMNRVDAWWNRHFPPFSIRRLLFGIAALPLIGALQELLWMAMGRDLSLPRYLFVCVAGAGLLASAWLPGMRETAERLRASGAIDTRSPWPWHRRNASAPTPLPQLRASLKRDFLVALPFTSVMMLVISATVMGLEDTFSPSGLLTNSVAALLSTSLIAFRRSVWSIVLVSIAGGLLGGFAVVLLSIMSFSAPGVGWFLIGWAFGAVMVFVFLYPMWRTVRDLEARGFRFPMWIVMGGSVLLVTGGALVFLAQR